MAETRNEAAKPLGFWSCWSLTVGCMIGSGVFMLPTLLAPFGMLSFGGWIISGAGAIALALVFGRLAARTQCNGGPYAYTREAFGDLPGFLVAWAYWLSFLIAVPVVAIAFVGYLGVFVPTLSDNPTGQALTALALIAVFTLINIRGLKEMSVAQIALTVLKIIPLLAIMALAFAAGSPSNLPAFNPSGQPIFAVLAAVTLIALWPFTGFEVVTLPAANVKDCKRTIPRALVAGMVTVVAIYLAATAAVMMLVPAATLAQSQAPFAEAARGFGAWGPNFIAIGAMISTAGALNGLIFTCGQMPMAVALDKIAPRWLAVTGKGGTPHFALLLSAAISAAFLLANYTRGFLGAFTFMLMMATSLCLIYYFLVAVIELRHSWRASHAWAGVALIACVYSLFAAVGSGVEVLAWGAALMLAGIPLFYISRCATRAAPTSA